MAIKGSLKEASLPDIVQLLFLGRRTGCMSVVNDRHFATVWFDEGWITFAGLLARADRLGERLIAAGHLRRDQLELAITTQQASPGRRLGTVLLQLDLVDVSVIERELLVQVEETIFTLFAWDSGTFSFEAGLLPEPDEITLRLNPEGLLLEGARRVDEWSVISRKVPSPEIVFAIEAVDLQRAGTPLDDTESVVMGLVDGALSVREIADRAGLTEFAASRALYGLASAGRVRRVGTAVTPSVIRGSESRVNEHRNLGLAFYRTGMLGEAEREYRRVVELRPQDGEGLFRLGLVTLRQARWTEASQLLRQAAELSGPRPAILHNLTLALEGMGRLDEAEAAQAEAVSQGADNPIFWLGWGLIALRRQEIETALQRLNRARVLFGANPLPARWYWGCGWAEALMGDWNGAVETLRQGVSAYHRHPILRTTLGVLLESGGAIEEAEEQLRRALTEDPAIPQISKNLGDLLYRGGRWDEAEESFRRAAALAPELGDDLFFKLGNLACRRGDIEEARRQWEIALTINPAHALVQANLASSEKK